MFFWVCVTLLLGAVPLVVSGVLIEACSSIGVARLLYLGHLRFFQRTISLLYPILSFSLSFTIFCSILYKEDELLPDNPLPFAMDPVLNNSSSFLLSLLQVHRISVYFFPFLSSRLLPSCILHFFHQIFYIYRRHNYYSIVSSPLPIHLIINNSSSTYYTWNCFKRDCLYSTNTLRQIVINSFF